ncbi:hypothetical protein DM860_010341 [Cuscuta australis]|uniref:Hepatocellular carcinoma-associated antigen 59 domain-containing protein n=1 Tax=Cuscuta australis TaxID=267555 RepID=A0A328D6X1_9ASTE|nr:hypothetical protein DM860_010341 [Cuscuta australis]
MKAGKSFRKRSFVDEEEDDEQDRRSALEEVKFLQKQREKKLGIPAVQTAAQPAPGCGPGATSNGIAGGLVAKPVNEKGEGDGEKDDLVLQDTFAQETAVMVEDPNMLRYIDQELAKKRGGDITATNEADSEVKHAEDELYQIPEHLKVKRRNSEESSTQWTTGIAEIQLPIEYKLKNIEETEAAKKLLQGKRFMGRTKPDVSIPSNYTADYFHRGKDYAEKLRREHPELYKESNTVDNSMESRASSESGATDIPAVRRQAATDELMLERFRKRERHRVMRR